MMPSPTLAELPPPPPGRAGWPWDLEMPRLPETGPGGKPWPRISIVTPSFNQGAFIEETIRSVLLQGYPDLEYIVMDGGSTDGTMEIVQKYAPWLRHFESAKDRGQAHAINKGFVLSTGDVFQWINSDDVLLPDALRAIATAPQGDAYAAGVVYFSQNSESIRLNFGLTPALFINQGAEFSFHQPGLWMDKTRARSLFPLEEDLHYVFDWYLWARYVAKWPRVSYIEQPVVKFRIHDASKTTSGNAAHSRKYEAEVEVMLDRLRVEFAGTGLQRFAERRLQQVRWRRELRDALQAHGVSTIGSLARVARRILARPSRLDRFSLGALRHMLLRKSR